MLSEAEYRDFIRDFVFGRHCRSYEFELLDYEDVQHSCYEFGVETKSTEEMLEICKSCKYRKKV